MPHNTENCADFTIYPSAHEDRVLNNFALLETQVEVWKQTYGSRADNVTSRELPLEPVECQSGPAQSRPTQPRHVGAKVALPSSHGVARGAHPGRPTHSPTSDETNRRGLASLVRNENLSLTAVPVRIRYTAAATKLISARTRQHKCMGWRMLKTKLGEL
jgi:hypothetical protein